MPYDPKFDGPVISLSEYERRIDAEAARRLAADPRYRNAENAEEQARAEEIIVTEIEDELLTRYTVR